MGERIRALVVKEFFQIARDQRTLAIILVQPMLMLFLFGYAINTTVDHIPTVIADQVRDQRSRDFVRAVVNTGYFDVVGDVSDAGVARSAIDSGEAKVAFVIPPTFGADALAGRPAQVQALIDGSDPNVAQTALLTANTLAQARGVQLLAESTGRSISPPLDLRPNILYNPGLQSANFMIPGLIGVILQIQAVLLTAFAVVRERERGTLEQLSVTPIRPTEMILGKLLPYVAIAFAQVGATLLIGTLWFGVPINGSLLLLMLLSLLFLIGALGIGLLISTVSRTQAQAMQTTMLTVMPAFIISGFMFPRESMPHAIRVLSYILPLTYFLEILRGIILKGIGLEYLYGQALALLVFAIVIAALSVIRFRRSLE